MEFKKRGLFLVVFILLSVNVLAQGFGFDFGFGRGGASSFSNIISSTLDLIFGGVIQPIFDYVNFSNFTAAAKLALWIVLFMLFSTIFKGYFKNMPTKFSKIIAAIIAFFGVAFIPDQLLEVLFRDFLSGAVGYLLFFAFIFFPLYWLYKWSKDSDDRAVSLVAAAGFFLMMLFISYLDSQVLYSFNYGIMQNLASLTIVFGVLASLILFIHRLVQGLKGMGGGEIPDREGRGERERRDEREEGDELVGVRASANQLANGVGQIIDHIGNISDDPAVLGRELISNPKRLDFINYPNFHNIYVEVERIILELEKIKGKKKDKARQIAKELASEYSGVRDSLGRYSSLRTPLQTHIYHKRVDPQFFSTLINSIKILNRDLQALMDVLSKINSL